MSTRITRAITRFRELNVTKTIYINFAKLPLQQAIKFPIYLYGKVYTKEFTGKIELKGQVHRAMVQIGSHQEHFLFGKYADQTTILNVNGILELGSGINIGNGVVIRIHPNATLSFGKNSQIGPRCRFYCETNIAIGANFRCSWDVQVFDSNFHYMYDDSYRVSRREAPIVIGDCVWIGNRVTINRGCVIPSNFIVASNSLVNKDFSEYNGQNGFLAGISAKYSSTHKHRVYSYRDDAAIKDYFNSHPDASEFQYTPSKNSEQ